jgi:hypothetical protein
MRAALPALVLLAAGCPAPPGADPFGTFAVAIDDVPTDDVVVTSLEVSVGEVVLEAEGPSGPESVAVLVDHVFEPLIAVDAVGFDLERGPHTGVWI